MNVKNFRYISILLGLFAAFLLIFLIGLPSGTQQSGSEFLRSDPLIELPYGEYNVELRDALTGIELNKDVYLLSSLSLFKHSGDIYLSGIEDSARIFNEALECENDVSMDLDTQVENNNKVALPVAMGKYFFPRISYVQRSVDGGIEFLGSDFLLELNSCQEYLLQVAESYECLAKQEGVQDYAGSFLQAVLSHALYELVDGRLYFIAQYLSESTKVQDLSAYASLGTCRVDLTQYLSSSEDFLITGEYILALNESRQAPPAFSLSTHHNILSDDLDQEEGKVIVDFRSSQGEPEGVDASVVDVNTGELVARYVRDPLFGSEEGGYCCASLSTSKLKAEWKEEGEPCDGHVVAVITKKEQCFFPSFSDELDPPPSELLPQCCYDPNTDKFEKSNAVAVFAPSEEGMEEYEQQQEAIDTEIKQRESSIRNREKAGKKVSNNEYNDLGDLRDRRNQPLIAGTCESQGKITVGHAAADPCNPASELSCCYYAAWDLYEYGLSQEEYSIADQVQRDGYVNEKQAEIDGMPDGTEDERQDKLNAQYDLDQVKNNPNQTPLVTMVKVCRLGDTIGVPVNKRYCSYGSIPVPSDTDTPYPTYSPSAISSATPYYSYPSPTSSPTQTETYVPYPTYTLTPNDSEIPSPSGTDESSGSSGSGANTGSGGDNNEPDSSNEEGDDESSTSSGSSGTLGRVIPIDLSDNDITLLKQEYSNTELSLEERLSNLARYYSEISNKFYQESSSSEKPDYKKIKDFIKELESINELIDTLIAEQGTSSENQEIVYWLTAFKQQIKVQLANLHSFIAKSLGDINYEHSEVVVKIEGKDVRLRFNKSEVGTFEITEWRDGNREWHPIAEAREVYDWGSGGPGETVGIIEKLIYKLITTSPVVDSPSDLGSQFSYKHLQDVLSSYGDVEISHTLEEIELEWLDSMDARQHLGKAKALLESLANLTEIPGENEFNEQVNDIRNKAKLELSELESLSGNFDSADRWSSEVIKDLDAGIEDSFRAYIQKISINLSKGNFEEALRQLAASYRYVETLSPATEEEGRQIEGFKARMDGMRKELERQHALMLLNTFISGQEQAFDLLNERFGNSGGEDGIISSKDLARLLSHLVMETGRVVWNVAGRAWELEGDYNQIQAFLDDRVVGSMILIKALEVGYTYRDLIEIHAQEGDVGVQSVLNAIYGEEKFNSLTAEQKNKLFYAFRSVLEHFDLALVAQLGSLTKVQQSMANTFSVRNPEHYQKYLSTPYGYLRAGKISGDFSRLESGWGEMLADMINVPNYMIGSLGGTLGHLGYRSLAALYSRMPALARQQVRLLTYLNRFRLNYLDNLRGFWRIQISGVSRGLLRFSSEVKGGDLFINYLDKFVPGLGIVGEIIVEAVFSAKLPDFLREIREISPRVITQYDRFGVMVKKKASGAVDLEFDIELPGENLGGLYFDEYRLSPKAFYDDPDVELERLRKGLNLHPEDQAWLSLKDKITQKMGSSSEFAKYFNSNFNPDLDSIITAKIREALDRLPPALGEYTVSQIDFTDAIGMIVRNRASVLVDSEMDVDEIVSKIIEKVIESYPLSSQLKNALETNRLVLIGEDRRFRELINWLFKDFQHNIDTTEGLLEAGLKRSLLSPDKADIMLLNRKINFLKQFYLSCLYDASNPAEVITKISQLLNDKERFLSRYYSRELSELSGLLSTEAIPFNGLKKHIEKLLDGGLTSKQMIGEFALDFTQGSSWVRLVRYQGQLHVTNSETGVKESFEVFDIGHANRDFIEDRFSGDEIKIIPLGDRLSYLVRTPGGNFIFRTQTRISRGELVDYKSIIAKITEKGFIYDTYSVGSELSEGAEQFYINLKNGQRLNVRLEYGLRNSITTMDVNLSGSEIVIRVDLPSVMNNPEKFIKSLEHELLHVIFRSKISRLYSIETDVIETGFSAIAGHIDEFIAQSHSSSFAQEDFLKDLVKIQEGYESMYNRLKDLSPEELNLPFQDLYYKYADSFFEYVRFEHTSWPENPYTKDFSQYSKADLIRKVMSNQVRICILTDMFRNAISRIKGEGPTALKEMFDLSGNPERIMSELVGN